MKRMHFKKGDRVWDMMKKIWGEVIEIDSEPPFPIVVKYNYGYVHCYTTDGKIGIKDITRSLYYTDFKINPPLEAIEKIDNPNMKVDTKVYVWNDDIECEIKRHFSHFDKDGMIHCFVNGSSSFTTIDNETTKWDKWELAEEEE